MREILLIERAPGRIVVGDAPIVEISPDSAPFSAAYVGSGL